VRFTRQYNPEDSSEHRLENSWLAERLVASQVCCCSVATCGGPFCSCNECLSSVSPVDASRPGFNRSRQHDRETDRPKEAVLGGGDTDFCFVKYLYVTTRDEATRIWAKLKKGLIIAGPFTK
jgi:hypothetical protein